MIDAGSQCSHTELVRRPLTTFKETSRKERIVNDIADYTDHRRYFDMILLLNITLCTILTDT